jgi:molybdenum cofactor biosynthesis protein A
MILIRFSPALINFFKVHAGIIFKFEGMEPAILYDNHNRPISYLRIAVTDRCNLRCFYCMPEEGIRYLPKRDLLTFEEIIRLTEIFAGLGITKVRITGGEPFLRKDLIKLMGQIRVISGISELHITTNGLLAGNHLDDLVRLKIDSVNLSLDTLDAERFRLITRRDEFYKTWEVFKSMQQAGIPVKVNAVVMEGKNIDDILPLAELTKHQGISVRFIEEMPFNGTGMRFQSLQWNEKRILDYLKSSYPQLETLPGRKHDTAKTFQIPGYSGTIGIIAAYTRSFCGTCNRIRLTAQGMLKTCLYDQGVLNVRDLLRSGCSDDEIRLAFVKAFSSRPKDGFEAEKNFEIKDSMSTIGG